MLTNQNCIVEDPMTKFPTQKLGPPSSQPACMLYILEVIAPNYCWLENTLPYLSSVSIFPLQMQPFLSIIAFQVRKSFPHLYQLLNF